MVIRPYGYALWEYIQSEIDSRIKAAGAANAYFAGVGELDDFPRVNWFTEVEHANDGRLREALSGLQELPTAQRQLAMAALTGSDASRRASSGSREDGCA